MHVEIQFCIAFLPHLSIYFIRRILRTLRAKRGLQLVTDIKSYKKCKSSMASVKHV